MGMMIHRAMARINNAVPKAQAKKEDRVEKVVAEETKPEYESRKDKAAKR